MLCFDGTSLAASSDETKMFLAYALIIAVKAVGMYLFNKAVYIFLSVYALNAEQLCTLHSMFN